MSILYIPDPRIRPEPDTGRKTQNPAAFKDCIIWCQWSQGDVRTTVDPLEFPGLCLQGASPGFCFGLCLFVFVLF